MRSATIEARRYLDIRRPHNGPRHRRPEASRPRDPRLCCPSPVASADVLLNGSGSTFAFPLYSKRIDAFHQREPSIRVNYQSIGSGAAIATTTAGTTDSGASSGPTSDPALHGPSAPLP